MYIVMPYIKGDNLTSYIDFRSNYLTEYRVKQIAYQILVGIDYLHSMGIVHRDLKLDNIMMTGCSKQATPVIADFGLATILGPGQLSVRSSGTVGFCAPEVLIGKPYGKSCDMWGYGCMLYAMLVKSLPFVHEDKQEIIRMTVQDRLCMKEEKWDQISHEAKNLVHQLLRKSSSKRISAQNALKHPWFTSITQ